MSMLIKVETSNGVYELFKPKGKIGIKHMGILLKVARVFKGQIDPEDAITDDRIIELYEKWCEEVLPHIILKSPFKYEDIPFDDMFNIFLEMMAAADISEHDNTFREERS